MDIDIFAFNNEFKFDELQRAIELTEMAGPISQMPTSITQAHKHRQVSGGIKTIRNYLFLLGYIYRDSGSERMSLNLLNAIAAFQKDMGLKQDKWCGHKTWQVLHNLCSFQSIGVVQYMQTRKSTEVVMRATGVRLATLGLLEHDALNNHDAILDALLNFGLYLQEYNYEVFDYEQLDYVLNPDYEDFDEDDNPMYQYELYKNQQLIVHKALCEILFDHEKLFNFVTACAVKKKASMQ